MPRKGNTNKKLLTLEMGSFTALVFGTNGGMGKECKSFLSNLADKLSRKNGESYASAIYLGLDHAYLLKF